MSKLSVKYNLVNDSNVYEYKESIRNVHQYSGVDLNIHKSSLDSFIIVKINKYPYTYLNYPSTTYEWKPNQWLFMKDDENEKYKRCSEFYDETAEYFLFPSDYFTSGGLYEFTVTPIFNISGNYAITIDEYSQTDNSLLNELVIYVEVVDIKTLNITTPFDGEGDEFGGWNKSVSKDVYTLLQQNSNDFRMCIYNGEESGNEIVGNLYGIDSNVYNGFNDTLFYIKENDTEKEVYGVVVEAFVENCFIRESSDNDYLNQVKICKLAFSGVYKTFPSSLFSESCKVYFDGVNFKLNNENKGVIVGNYDAERGVLSLERGFSADDINSLITGDFGDMLVSRSDSWGLLKAGRKGSVLTVEESNGVKSPRWKMPSSVYGKYMQYVNVYSDKFQIKNGDALKFTEIYSNDSKNIEESGVDVFTLDENDGSVYLGDLEPTSYIITTSEDVEFIPPTEDWFEGYKYNIDFDGEETRFVINNDEIPERLIPEETSLVKYAKKGAVAIGEVETNDVEAKTGEYSYKKHFYGAGDYSPIMWYLFEDSDDHLNYKLFDSEKNEFITKANRFYTDDYPDIITLYDFYGMDGLKGILATADIILDGKQRYKITISTNIKNEFTDYRNFQSYSDSLHVDIGTAEDDHLDRIIEMKIIKHENFYTLYYAGLCYENSRYLRIGCISFVVNFSTDEDSSIDVVRHTTTTYTENYSIEDNTCYIPKFYVESINKQNDVILFCTENDNWKVFMSSEVNSFGDMSINYYTDLTSNIFTSSSEIKGLDVAKVSENVCAVVSLEQVDTNTVINRMRLLVYKETLDTENIDVQGKRYIKSIEIIEESKFASYNYLLQSPIMNNYTVSFDQDILEYPYNQPIKIIGIGRDSFAVFYKALNYLRCAIGTVGTYIDSSEGNVRYDIFWQEVKNALALDANYMYSRKLAKAKDSNGNDKVLLCYNYNHNSRVEGITKLMTFSTVYEDNIMGVAGLYDEGYRMICYKGEVDTVSLNNTNIGVNVYCDDFGNLTEVHTKNYIGQYIGNGRIVKN